MSLFSRRPERISVPALSHSLRVLLIADTHGLLDARILTLGHECDLILHAGDIGGKAVIQALQGTGRPWLAVRGNNDLPGSWGDGSDDRLPERLWIELPTGLIGLLHGHQHNPVGARHARLRDDFFETRAVVYGHSHRLVCDLDERPWVLNPGAAGRVRTYGGPSCILLHIHGERWQPEPIRFPPLPMG